MARDVMAVRLHLAQIRVLEVIEDTPGALVPSVESTLRRQCCAHWSRSSSAGCMTAAPRGSATVEVSGRRMTLVWRWRRMVSSDCASRILGGTSGLRGRANRAFVASGRW